MKDVTTVQGRDNLEKFKMEAASEVGVNLRNGYNGDLTSREAGAIGGQMVNMMSPEQQWLFIRHNVRRYEHCEGFEFTMQIGV
ncbi:MAG: alpha/beta-type small acid-soluble spore protein [Oscillospiraceae bacterium]|nr:alpha/beta-type small acid-soluble spore protein [Oscillospiraceae bacterium]